MSGSEPAALVRPEHAARVLGVSVRTVRRWVHCGELAGRVVLGRVYVLRSALLRFECVTVPE